MSPAGAAWLWMWILEHLPGRWRRVPLSPIQVVLEAPTSPLDDYVPWDIAAETGEFTHILKDGTTAISVVLGRAP